MVSTEPTITFTFKYYLIYLDSQTYLQLETFVAHIRHRFRLSVVQSV
jgi:hypothetical protein